MAKNFYDVLEVSKDASHDDIRKSYKKLAKKYHPDHNKEPEAVDRFKEVSEAYEVLSDADSRQQYDTFGHVNKRNINGFGNVFTSDFFDNIFMHHGASHIDMYDVPQGIRMFCDIEFLDAVFGCEKDIKVDRYDFCDDCHGNGSKKGSSLEQCSYCQGRGMVTSRQGMFVMNTTCPNCSGKRRVIKEKCLTCHGKCVKQVNSTFTIKVPPGISNHSIYTLRNAGHCYAKGHHGDISCVINVKSHPLFIRENDNIICECPINYHQAVLGAELYVPNLDGTVAKLDMPPYTQHGQEFVISDINNGKFIVRIKLCVPDNADDQYRKSLSQYSNLKLKDIDIFKKNVSSFIKAV